MSEEQAKACVEKLKSDEDFRARVMAAGDVDARMALIVAEGFDCGAEEIRSLEELGEAELNGVTGGGGGARENGGGCSTGGTLPRFANHG
jgi:predicted ribosomally synthesized peptide with nif11-like leader